MWKLQARGLLGEGEGMEEEQWWRSSWTVERRGLSFSPSVWIWDPGPRVLPGLIFSSDSAHGVQGGPKILWATGKRPDFEELGFRFVCVSCGGGRGNDEIGRAGSDWALWAAGGKRGWAWALKPPLWVQLGRNTVGMRPSLSGGGYPGLHGSKFLEGFD